jgi:hypothetical protein
MAVPEIEPRVAALEPEVNHLRERLDAATNPASPWWQQIYGTFANDPLYEKAMRLRHEYRESLRPNPTKKGKR